MKIEKSLIVVPRNLNGDEEQTLFQLIDIDDTFHFELLWTGTQWVDCPGENIETAIIEGAPNVQDWTTAPREWTDSFFPGALESRFTKAQQAAIDNFMKLNLADRAVKISELIHEGEKDLTGRDYYRHVVRTAVNVALIPTYNILPISEQLDVALGAWLSRSLEREATVSWPKVLPSDLAEWGMTRGILSVVEFLTPETTLMQHLGQKRDAGEHIRSVGSHLLARLVKIAQIADEGNRQRQIWFQMAGHPVNLDALVHQLESLDLTNEEEEWLDSRATDSCELFPDGFGKKSAEDWKTEFGAKFGALFDAMSREPVEQVELQIQLLYYDYKWVQSRGFREVFDNFRAVASNYLLSKSRKDAVLVILSDVKTPPQYNVRPRDPRELELSNLKSAATPWTRIGPIPWFEDELEDFPPSTKEQQNDK